jgi:hypothetical protein
MVSMVVLPFESLWNVARAGDLKIGTLHLISGLEPTSLPVQLSGFRGDRPVVLIFGSYTRYWRGGSRQQIVRTVQGSCCFLRCLHSGGPPVTFGRWPTFATR